MPTSATPLIDSAEVTARTCKTAEANDLTLQCIPDAEFGSIPHFLPEYFVAGEPSRRALDVSWTGVTGRARMDVSSARSLTGATSLDLRVAVPSGAAKATFAVVLGDAAGHRLTLPDASVTGLPA